MSDVTVVIPTRNRRPLLAEAVDSVARQAGVDWQLVVVDDCSTDDTPSYLNGLTDPRISAIRLAEHSERSAARNRGLAAASGECVVFLDDDDRLRPRALVTLVSALRNRPQAVAAMGARVAFDDQGHRRRARHPRRRRLVDLWPVVIVGWGALPGQGHTALRTDVLRAAGGWD